MIDLENSQSNHYGISSINLLFCLWKFQKSKVTSLWLIELISKVRHFKTQDYKARKYVLYITFLDWSLFCFYPFWLAIVIIDKNNDNIYISKRALHMLNIVSHVHRFKHTAGYTSDILVHISLYPFDQNQYFQFDGLPTDFDIS